VVPGAILSVIEPPSTPLAAVTHADPYPYYASLVAQRPFYRDDALGLWVASSAAAVRSVMTSDQCRVRPPAEPVPKALVGSPAGEIFGQLARMNDGANHLRAKLALLTSKGRATLKRSHPLQVEWSNRVAKGITADRIQTCSELLRELRRRLGDRSTVS